MIFDWYRGGDWGGIPVCRLGHIMADLVNASYVLYQYIRYPGTYTAPAYRKGNGTVISFATEPNATASWWDGLPVGSGIIRDNYREAFTFLEGLTDNRALTASQFVADDYESDLTLADLGLDGIDADSLTRAQQGAVWARVRQAFDRVRYLRRATIPVCTVSAGDSTKTTSPPALDPLPDQYTAPVNSNVSSAWAALSYGPAPAAHIWSYINGSCTATTSSGSVYRTKSIACLFRKDVGIISGVLDLPVMRAQVKWRSSTIPPLYAATLTPLPTDQGNISDGAVFDFGYAVEEASFALEETKPFFFPAGAIAVAGVTYGRGYSFVLANGSHIVYDIDAEDYPS